mmetsp:Transcript_6322/g.10909  ORF Transcript_6322/g.10909 Transcript_6322/m.10909 type:complete len:289 (-) Transcript_6322:677-1543(-)
MTPCKNSSWRWHREISAVQAQGQSCIFGRPVSSPALALVANKDFFPARRRPCHNRAPLHEKAEGANDRGPLAPRRRRRLRRSHPQGRNPPGPDCPTDRGRTAAAAAAVAAAAALLQWRRGGRTYCHRCGTAPSTPRGCSGRLPGSPPRRRRLGNLGTVRGSRRPRCRRRRPRRGCRKRVCDRRCRAPWRPCPSALGPASTGACRSSPRDRCPRRSTRCRPRRRNRSRLRRRWVAPGPATPPEGSGRSCSARRTPRVRARERTRILGGCSRGRTPRGRQCPWCSSPDCP